ncbi:MAG: hypothetical protein HOV92_36975 [Streptomyces sp.]|nr:hypothetical protein [Streptomyces sp.]
MRRDPRLEIITEAIQRLIPGATPAFLTVEVSETLPGTRERRNTWSGRPEGLATKVFTALYGRPRTEESLSPLARAEEAKRRRDLAGEVGVLMSAGADLESAPWHPVRPGDLVHVHYEAGGSSDAFGETYVVTAGEGGFLSMRLLAHTLQETAETSGLVGCFAVEDDPDPLMELWFEAGPQRLTIVRDGQVVHDGPARGRGQAATRILFEARGHAATMREVQRYLERGEPELALARLMSGKPLPPCGAPGFTAEQADCARARGHRGGCSDDPNYVEPPHECPTLPEQLYAVVSVGPTRRTVSFEGLYEDKDAALDVAAGWGLFREAEVRVGQGMPDYTFVDLLDPGKRSLAVVAPMPVKPDPRAEDDRDGSE